MSKNKETKLNVIKLLSKTFIAALAITVVSSPSITFAKNSQVITSVTLSNSSEITDSKTYVSPDASLIFNLPMTDSLLQSLHLRNNGGILESIGSKKDYFGVLTTDGTTDYLATLENGMLSVSINGNDVVIKSTHPTLNRYTSYQNYVLTGSALNKYEASVKSGGKSKAFAKYLESAIQSGEAITLPITVGSNIGEATQWEVTIPAIDKVLTTEGVNVEISVTDDYGNPATDGTFTYVGATDPNGNSLDGIVASPIEVQIVDGKANIEINSDRTQDATINFEAVGEYAEDKDNISVDISFIKPVEPGSSITTQTVKNEDGTTTIIGTVIKDGQPVSNVGVPLDIQNGNLSDSIPVTDENGNFTVIVNKDTDAAAVVVIDNTKAPGVSMPNLIIDPMIYGNQAWTDTGIDITNPYTLIAITNATGSWTNNLYAKVGIDGAVVNIGTNGFVTGVTGRLYLGPNDKTYSDNVDCSFMIVDPESIGIYPTLNLVSSEEDLKADGKSTATISGKVMYGVYPLVTGNFNLNATFGTLNNTVVTTDGTGSYTSIFTAGNEIGDAVITGTYENLTQTATIKLTAAAVGEEFTKSISGKTNWTDTGIVITSPKTLIKVEASGAWVGNYLYAKVGNSSNYVKLGTNGGFVTGITGTLYLGPNYNYNSTYANADVKVTIVKVEEAGIEPTLVLTSGNTSVGNLPNQSVSITGKVIYDTYPLVDGYINFSTDLGKVNVATSKTNTTGAASVSLSSTVLGMANVTASYETLSETISIEVKESPKATNVKMTSGYLYYSLNNGSTWTKVTSTPYLTSYIYDAVHKVYIAGSYNTEYTTRGGYGYYMYGYIYKSYDGINWYSQSAPGSGYTVDGLAVNANGTIVMAGRWDTAFGLATGIFASTDGGTTWTKVAEGYKSNSLSSRSGKFWSSQATVSYNGTQFVVKGNYGTYYSTTGLTW